MVDLLLKSWVEIYIFLDLSACIERRKLIPGFPDCRLHYCSQLLEVEKKKSQPKEKHA